MRTHIVQSVDGQETHTYTTDFMCAEHVACSLFSKSVEALAKEDDYTTPVFVQVMCEGMCFDVQCDRGGALSLVRVV